MTPPEPFVWTARIQTGIALFALSLVGLAVVAPNLVAISCAIGGGASLGLFGISGARFPLLILALLALVTFACALFAAIVLRQFHLLPVAFGEMASVIMILASRPWHNREDNNVILRPARAARVRSPNAGARIGLSRRQF